MHVALSLLHFVLLSINFLFPVSYCASIHSVTEVVSVFSYCNVVSNLGEPVFVLGGVSKSSYLGGVFSFGGC